jgi:hypothetical protein
MTTRTAPRKEGFLTRRGKRWGAIVAVAVLALAVFSLVADRVANRTVYVAAPPAPTQVGSVVQPPAPAAPPQAPALAKPASVVLQQEQILLGEQDCRTPDGRAGKRAVDPATGRKGCAALR